MAKFYGSIVKTGKVGGSVFSVRNGETIERQYQPIVSNPNTAAQVKARAILKLMSQVAAVFAPIIAIPRSGAVSSRNRFIKLNYGAANYDNEQADISLANVKITKSVLGLPAITAVMGQDAVNVALSKSVTGIDRVVYVAILRQSDGTLRYVGSTVVTEAGANGTYAGTITTGTSLVVNVYAYGIRDNSQAARVKFGEMNVTAENIAQLIVTRVLLESDISLTETQYVISESL